jgi:hypothetical protein
LQNSPVNLDEDEDVNEKRISETISYTVSRGNALGVKMSYGMNSNWEVIV